MNRISRNLLIPIILCLLALVFGCQSVQEKLTTLPKSKKERISRDDSVKPGRSLIGYRAPEELIRDNLIYANQQFLLKNYNVAEYYLKKTLVQNPDEQDAQFLLPWTHFFQKRFELALINFSRTHSQYPRDSHPLIGMGWCYFAMQYYEQALDAFQRAAHFAPDAYQVIKGKALSYLQLAKKDEALLELEKIFREDEVLGFMASVGTKTELQNWEIIPSKKNAASVFSLPEEKPRYRSLLYTLEEPTENGPVNAAWLWYRKGFYKRAVAAFEDMDSEFSSTLDAQNGLAWSLFSSGAIEEAQRVFEKLLNRHPTFQGAVEGLETIEATLNKKASIAQHYFDLQKYRLAEIKYQDLETSYRHWSHPTAMLGTIALANNREEEAWIQFNEALNLNPDDPVAQKGLDQLQLKQAPPVYRGNQALKMKDYQTASYQYWDYIQSLGPKAELEGHLADAYKGLAWSQLEKGLYGLALDNFDRIQHMPGFNDDVARGKGLAYYRAREFGSAVEWLQQAEMFYPGRDEVAEALDWSVLRAYPPHDAESYFLARLKRFPRQASTYMALGWVYYKNGDPDLGVEYFLKSISLEPELALSREFVAMLGNERYGWQVFNRMGWEYFQRKEFPLAQQLFQVALNREPENSESLKGLGYVYHKFNNYQLAEKHLIKSLKQNRHPTTVEEVLTGSETTSPVYIQTNALTKLGRVMLEQEKYDRALEIFEKAKKVHPDWPEINDGLGWVYLNLGKLNQSRASFNKAIQYQPLHPDSRKGLRQIKSLKATQNL